MKVIEVNCYKETNCSVAVGMWNYWDHEHVVVVHKGLKEFFVLEENDKSATILGKAHYPVFTFLKYTMVNTMVQRNENTLVGMNTMFGIPIRATITITETEKDHSKYHMKYEFFVEGWRKPFVPLFEPFLRRLMSWWNQRQWDEDLEIKERRQKVLRMGFKDFKGMPESVEDREYNGPLSYQLPIPRLPGSPVDKLN